MADSVDRVFVHALNTVKKIPKTGAARPPPADRMRLYGLYKQAMEGDVDGVMERPSNHSRLSSDELRREQDKWDAWNAEHGLSRTEAKRRYIETLIETMHTYATTPTAAELVAELEFVWNQIKDNHSPSSSSSYRKGTLYETPEDNLPRLESASHGRPDTSAGAGAGGGVGGYGSYVGSGGETSFDILGERLKVLSPMSEEDEAERENRLRMIDEELEAAGQEGAAEDVVGRLAGDHDNHAGGGGPYVRRGDQWIKKMERAMVKLSAEVAALREQIAVSREVRAQRQSPVAWFGWTVWVLLKHFAVDAVLVALALLWFRRRKDRRVEDHVRGALTVLREYVRKVLPSR